MGVACGDGGVLLGMEPEASCVFGKHATIMLYFLLLPPPHPGVDSGKPAQVLTRSSRVCSKHLLTKQSPQASRNVRSTLVAFRGLERTGKLVKATQLVTWLKSVWLEGHLQSL